MSDTTAVYTGDVVTGGAAVVREPPGLRMTKLSVGPYDNNAYLIECTATGERLLIDAAAEPQRLLAWTEPGGRHHLWSGDCLFPGGIGKTYNDPACFASLYQGVVTKIFDAYPDDMWIYPGRGKDTTLGAQRPQLSAWDARG